MSADIAKDDWLAKASKTAPPLKTKSKNLLQAPKGMDNSLLLDDDPMFQL